MEVRADVEEPLDDAGILGHGGHVQHVLPVVLVGEEDIIEEEGEVHQEPLGKVEVDGGALEEAHMEHRLSNTAPGQINIFRSGGSLELTMSVSQSHQSVRG